jgi:hypothetical protein
LWKKKPKNRPSEQINQGFMEKIDFYVEKFIKARAGDAGSKSGSKLPL